MAAVGVWQQKLVTVVSRSMGSVVSRSSGSPCLYSKVCEYKFGAASAQVFHAAPLPVSILCFSPLRAHLPPPAIVCVRVSVLV